VNGVTLPFTRALPSGWQSGMGAVSVEFWLKQKAPGGFVWYTYYTPGVDHQLNARVSATDGLMQCGEFLKKKNNIKQK
jgi:hypothetical protein